MTEAIATSISNSASPTAEEDNNISADNSTVPSSPFNVDEELAKIAESCLNMTDYENINGNVFKHFYAYAYGHHLIRESNEIIGLAELRAALGFGPLPPWTHYVLRSKEEIDAAPTIETYYDLKEHEEQGEKHSLDSFFFFEHNFPLAIAFLDRRFPSIRAIYRHRFEEIRRQEAIVDRKEIDRMFEEWLDTLRQVEGSIERMFDNERKCEKRDRKRKE